MYRNSVLATLYCVSMCRALLTHRYTGQGNYLFVNVQGIVNTLIHGSGKLFINFVNVQGIVNTQIYRTGKLFECVYMNQIQSGDSIRKPLTWIVSVRGHTHTCISV